MAKTSKIFSFVLLFWIFSTPSVKAQDRTSYDLLWKLEKEGTKPSYLFGTMHVKDERVFQFSDSVLIALESCEQFALELHPDSMFKIIVDEKFFNSIDSPDKLLTQEEMQILKSKFKATTGMDYENFNFRNPLALREFLSAESQNKPQRKTFLDAYLLGLAKTFQKSIHGLERIESQLASFSEQSSIEQREDLIELLNNELDNSGNFLDQFIDTYSKGNLRNLEKYVSGSLDLPAFIERNKTMATSIDQLHSKGSIFSAIGAAHLIGENSVLKLLEQKGFKVKRVKANFTGIAKDYKIDHSKMKWQKFVDSKKGFSIETPGVLVKVPGDEFEFINMHSMIDLTGANSFIIFSIDLRSLPKDMKEKDMKKLLLDQFKKKDSFTHTKSNKFFRDNIEFNELYLEKEDGSATRIQYCHDNNNLFVNACFGFFSRPFPKEQDRFFNSFKTFQPNSNYLNNSKWKNKAGAFSINFPEEPAYLYNELENPINLNGDKFIVHIYSCLIPENNSVGYVAYNDYPTGYYLDSSYDGLNETLNELNQQGKVISEVDTSFIGDQLTFEFNYLAQNKFPSKMKFLFRGNRAYRIFELALGDDKNIDYSKFDPFLNSFELLPYGESKRKKYSVPEDSFDISFFDSKVLETDTIFSNDIAFNQLKFWSNTNPSSGGFYQLERSKISKYFKADNADTLLFNYTQDLLYWGDSITYKKFTEIDALPAYHIRYQNKYTDKLDEVVTWYDGEHIYCIYRIASDEEMRNDELLEIANSFNLKIEVRQMDLSSSKAEQIITDLNHDEMEIRDRALGSFSYYQWDEYERNILEKALYQEFEKDTNEIAIKRNLVSALASLNDSISRNFLLNHYLNQSEDLKEYILSTLAYDDTGIDNTIMDLFIKETPKKNEAEYFSFFYALEDSLEIPMERLSDFIEILKDEYYEKEILHLITQVLITFPETEPLISENMHILTNNSVRDFNTYREMVDKQEIPSYRLIQNYLDLSKSIKHPTFVEPYTRLLGTLEANWIKNEAIEARVINGLSVKKSKIKSNLKNEYTRYNLLRAYEKADRFDELPKKYHSEEEKARTALIEYISWDDQVPDELKLLGLLNNSDSTYYCFELKYVYTRNNYLGIAGPFIQNEAPTKLKNIKAFTDWEALNDDWKTQSEKLIPLLEDVELIKY